MDLSAQSAEKAHKEVPSEKNEAYIQKILENYPGNLIRKRATTVDFTELESLRRLLVQSHAKQVEELTKDTPNQRKKLTAIESLRGCTY